MIRKPRAILALLTGLNFLNYLDRYLVAAVLLAIRDDLGMSSFAAGALGTVFLLGYFVVAPYFGSLGDRVPRKYIIALGVALWSLATVGSGIAGHTGSMTLLFVSRALVGVGEAAYATLAPTIIDDITPPEKKGRALAIFYLATPLGSALGFLLGGMILKEWGWEAAFYVCGAPGMLLALTCLLIAEPERQIIPERVPIATTLRNLMHIPLYRRVVRGYVFHTAAVGAFAHWGPSFISMRYGMELGSAGFWFGLVTVAAGAIATLVGGALVDRAKRNVDARGGSAGLRERRLIGEMIRVCGIGLLIAAPATAVLFWMPAALPFFIVAFVAEVGVFLSTSPVNAATLRAVPPGMRASAMAASIFAIHLFGDIWTPATLGFFIDTLPLGLAMMFLPVLFAVGAWVWWPRAKEIEISDEEAAAIAAAAQPAAVSTGRAVEPAGSDRP